MLFYVKQRAEQRLRDIEAAVYRERQSLGVLRFEGQSETVEVGVGHRWTDAENACWLHGDFTIPREWAGERVGLWIDIPGTEPLLYLDGQPAQALDYNHQDVLLYDSAPGGAKHTFAIECYAPSRGSSAEIKAADLVCIDRDAYALLWDFTTALQLLEVLPESEREGQGLLVALNAAMNALDYTQGIGTDAYYASLPAAREALQEHFFRRYRADTARDPVLVCAGHSHIDLAYLWTLANTKKKIGRTFATALRLMDEFPEYHFTQSQPQLYAYAREHYPELYERLKARVAEGRWEITGGMWVEADCNVTAGEALIRQILLGNRFFQREFGKRTKVLWLPDVFGYPASLPQIMRGCGLSTFMTSKISWSQVNRFPYDTFLWRGIDGTEVLTHFLTAPAHHNQLGQVLSTYNGQLTAWEVRGTWDQYRQKGINHELLNLFGHGDGGGGPTRGMIEIGRRLLDVAGIPRCSFGGAEAYFDRLAGRLQDERHLPRWMGELYLENHRGTLTSQGAIKRANRENEIRYRNAELFSALALVEAGEPYPQETLNRGWEKLLLNQFHDILPGTCITAAVQDSLQDHEEISSLGQEVLDRALDTIAGSVRTPENAVVLFNPTDTLRPADVAVVTVAANAVRKGAVEFADEYGAPLVSQFLSATSAGTRHLVLVPEVGALGYQTLTVGKAGGRSEGTNLRAEVFDNGATRAILENDLVTVQFDSAGEIIFLVHKLDGEEDEEEGELIEREVIASGRTGNALVVYEDKPYAYDGWNIDAYYEDKPYPLREIATIETFQVIETGPVRAGLLIRRRFLHSTLTQRIYLYAHSPRLIFDTEVEWGEKQMLLKAAFPVAVQSTRATYEIQFGSVERPTHRNTSWDWARFEVAGHKWADLSEGDYGVSILSDSKYGWDCHDNTLRLTLIKSGIHPDPQADQGRHTFSYALLPHAGDWRSETVDEAHAFCYPLLSRYIPANPNGALPLSYAFATVDDQGLIIETIKKAEDSDGIVIRLYEAFNTRGTATLTLGFDISEAFTVNLVEEHPEAVEHGRNSLSFTYRPFEIKTFLLIPQT